VASIAKGFVLRVPASAQANHGPPRKTKRVAVRVVDREFTLDSQRSVLSRCDFGQVFLLGLVFWLSCYFVTQVRVTSGAGIRARL